MKKIGFLLVGLMLAATTAFGAEEAKKDMPPAKWDFSESNVEFKAYLYNSQSGAIKMGKDEDFILKVKKQLDEKTWISFKYDTDDSNPDTKIEVIVNRKFNEYLEAQLDMDLVTADGSGIDLREDDDSEKVFIKYTPNNKLAVKFNPYDIDLEVGDEYNTKDTKGSMVVPGLQMEYKLSDTMMVYGGLGAAKATDTKGTADKTDDKDKTALGLKAGFENKTGNSSLIGMFAINTQDDKNIAAPSPIKMAANLRGSYKSGNISVKGEVLATKLNKAAGMKDEKGEIIDSTDFALYAKAGYKMGTMTPYIAGRYIGGSVYFDDDDYCAILKDTDTPLHGGLTSIEAENEFELTGGLKIVPYVEFLNAKEEIFKDSDGNAKKSTVTLNTKVKVTF